MDRNRKHSWQCLSNMPGCGLASSVLAQFQEWLFICFKVLSTPEFWPSLNRMSLKYGPSFSQGFSSLSEGINIHKHLSVRFVFPWSGSVCSLLRWDLTSLGLDGTHSSRSALCVGVARLTYNYHWEAANEGGGGSLVLTLSFWLNPTDLIIEAESWGGDAIVEEVGGHFKEFTQYLCFGRTLFIHSQLHLKGSADKAWALLWAS